jgi:hypothetical protein
METEISLPCSDVLEAQAHPEPYESNSHSKPYCLKLHFKIMFPSTPRFSERSLPFSLSKQSSVSAVFISHVRATCAANPIVLDLKTLIILGEAREL